MPSTPLSEIEYDPFYDDWEIEFEELTDPWYEEDEEEEDDEDLL